MARVEQSKMFKISAWITAFSPSLYTLLHTIPFLLLETLILLFTPSELVIFVFGVRG